MSPEDQRAIDEYEQRQSFLAPFRRITDAWSVQTQHKFQKRLRALDLVASGDLESNWNVDVVARDTGVVVAQFGFNEHGRYHDMRRVDYTKPIPPANMIEWVKSKVDKRQIRFSALAERLGVSFSDPRVIHDLAYRFARSDKFNLKRRRWYNKGKEASVNDLYDQLSEAMLDIVQGTVRTDLTS